MAMIKRVTLTIAKNNASVKLSQSLRFYKNDSLLLQFEIERWNFEINQAEVVKPLYAVAFVETPDGTDMLECTILDEQIVQFQLLQKHTAIIGQGRMQIVIRDSHGSDDEACQSATPPFAYEVEELINDSQILTDENGNVIITDEAKPVFSSSTFATVDELEELELVDEESYLFITKDKKSYKAKLSALSDEVYVTVEQADKNYAKTIHNHEISNVNGLQKALDGKMNRVSLVELATSGDYNDIIYNKPDLSVYALKTEVEELTRQIEELKKQLENGSDKEV